MKTTIKIISLLMFAAISSCKKETNTVQLDGGSINVTNAIIGAPTLNMMNAPNVVSANNSIANNNYAFLPIVSGQVQAKFGVPAIAATPTSPAVPAVVYFTAPVTVDKNSNYSLFLTGTSINAIDNVLIKENYAHAYADSTFGVRFINLSPGSSPISVDIAGSANGSEANNLAYKAYSNFVKHPALKSTLSYKFEFRDATTGNLITTYTLPTPYFHNVTLCLRGTVAGSVGVIRDNDY